MNRGSSWLWLLGAGLVVGACGSSDTGGPVTSGKSDGGTLLGDGALASTTLSGPCAAGATNACTCPALDGGSGSTAGVQHCYENNWLLCNCYAPTTPVVPVTLTGECKPGKYEGEFSGLYTSPYTFVGVPIPVVALNPAGPGLAFTLNANYTAAGEFSELTISDGFVKGAADGAFPFDGVLKGTLDCPTKTFTGTLTGRYCVGPCVGINEGKFDGPITGNYDGTTFSFTNGTWDLVELMGQMGLFGKYGGNGDWSAMWVGEGTVDLDSGTTTTDSDASVGP